MTNTEDTKADVDGDKESIIDDIDFELELIQRDEINVAHILELLAKLVNEVKTIQLCRMKISPLVTLPFSSN